MSAAPIGQRFEIRPCRTADGPTGDIEECPREEAQFWGVYERPPEGGPGLWHEDCPTEETAAAVVANLATALLPSSLRDAGYQLHFGSAEDGTLAGRFWWSYCAADGGDVQCSDGDWLTPDEAAANARSHFALAAL